VAGTASDFPHNFRHHHARKRWRRRLEPGMLCRQDRLGSGWFGGLSFGSYWWIVTPLSRSIPDDDFRQIDALLDSRKLWVNERRWERMRKML